MVDPEGRAVRITYHVLSAERDVVTLTETTSDPDGTVLRVDRGMLRFIDLDTLNRALTGAGFAIDVQHGGWLDLALRPDSAEIVTFARRQ